ncbi:MAG TPA: glycosyltransferase family 39 protein [Blastocatellia bacterium]|nr:glycosyltransferase family 39 protein [Blastocatellia bacterium]
MPASKNAPSKNHRRTFRITGDARLNLHRRIFTLRRRLAPRLAVRAPLSRRARLAISLLLFAVAFAVRALHADDLRPVIYTTNQPFGGLTAGYDHRAVDIVEGGGLLGPYRKPWQTEWLSQAPGYSIYLSAIYRTAGRDFFAVQLVQNGLTAMAPVLLFLIAARLFGWRVGVVAGLLAAVSHHLAHISNFILPDALCALPLLAAFYVLSSARRWRRAYLAYALAGLLVGLAAWLRPQLMLLGPFLVLMLALVGKPRLPAAKRALITAAVALLTIAPITIKNYLVYHEFVPINIGVGIVMWEGIADYSGDRFGAVATDDAVALQEAELYNEPRYAGSWTTPDGITRDRDRVRRSLAVIREHPLWYAGAMFDRCRGMVNYAAHAPLVYRLGQQNPPPADATVRPEWQALAARAPGRSPGQWLFWLRPVVRAAERLTKETMLAMIVIGALLGFVMAWRRAMFTAIVPFYYFIFQSAVHTEFRYTLPMQYFLFVFAALGWVIFGGGLVRVVLKRMRRGRRPVGESGVY